jgi:large subunit ribosomal protein L28
LARAAVRNSNRGLYGRKQVQHGYSISFSHNKSRRIWLPNIQKKEFVSEILRRKLSIKVTTSEIRTIKKYGGLDNYILKMKVKNLNSEYALELREKMRNSLKMQSLEEKGTSENNPVLDPPSLESLPIYEDDEVDNGDAEDLELTVRS